MAANFNNRLRFAVVKKSAPISEQLSNEFAISKWPTILVNIQNGADGATNIIYDGKLKLPEIKAWVQQYALEPSQVKEDFVIASKKRKESAAGQHLRGFTIIEEIEEIKELILDETNAGLLYVAVRNQTPHM